MGKFLFYVGLVCVLASAVTALVGLDVDFNGRSEVNPIASLALAVAAMAAFRGSKLVAWGPSKPSEPKA